MRKCPHCGELVHDGQDRCFACGQRVVRVTPRHSGTTNPWVFIAAAMAALAAVIGLVMVLPRQRRHEHIRRNQIEQVRVRDSVRRANVVNTSASQHDQEVAQLNGAISKLELRFKTVQQQVVSETPTPEQQRLITQIGSELVRLRMMVSAMLLAEATKRKAMADSVRLGQRRVRTMISDLTRAPKNH
ncbi:MAG: zinc ribbon domain-containing protein [candidate division WOR-3 bacterium]